eukprot:1186634-Prorocentrum_minimum.AAC.3
MLTRLSFSMLYIYGFQHRMAAIRSVLSRRRNRSNVRDSSARAWGVTVRNPLAGLSEYKRKHDYYRKLRLGYARSRSQRGIYKGIKGERIAGWQSSTRGARGEVQSSDGVTAGGGRYIGYIGYIIRGLRVYNKRS